MSRQDGRQLLYNHDNPLLGSLTSLKLTPKSRSPWGRPSISHTASSSTVARPHNRKDKEKSERGDKSSYGKAGLDGVLGEITEFNDGLTSTFVPQYTEFEQRVNSSLDNFQTQIERLQALHEQASRLHEQFQLQDTTVRQQLDEEITVLKKWETPRAKIKSMQDKVAKLRGVLSHGKERLQRIDKELSEAEEVERRVRSQVYAVNSTIFFVAVLFAFIAYLLVGRPWRE